VDDQPPRIGSIAVEINASLQRGYLFAPLHFSEPEFYPLMSAVPIDSKARMPVLKVIAVKLQRKR